MITKAQQAALKWLKDHGGSAAIARSRAGGRFYLAQGETGPFMHSTVKALIDAGAAEKQGGRIAVTSAGMEALSKARPTLAQRRAWATGDAQQS